MYVYDIASLSFHFKFRELLFNVFPENEWDEVDQQYGLIVTLI